MKQFQQDCCDLAGADVVNVDSVQVQLRPFNTERRTFPHLPKHGTHLNENVHSSQMTFNAQQLDTEKDGNYSHMRKRTEEKSEHSDIEQNSFVPSEDSFSVGDDAIEREDKKQSSKTSDYVSRSSSFKCSVSSDRIKNLVKSFEARINSSNPSPVINFPATDEKKKTVSRSKSDVSCRFSKTISVAPESNNSSDSELERFFNMMGLDNNMWQNLTAPPESPVHFFDSISSLNSEDRLSSSGSEDSALVVQQTEGLKNSDLQRHAPTDTSIVEKNARVVKWLYNCHNALRKNTS
ncbi:Protein FAM110C, partial [Stegodyphus mimosarum]